MRGYGHAGNIIDFGLLRDRRFAAANVTMIGFRLAIFGSIAILPLFLQGLPGYPVLTAGYLVMPRGLAAAVSMVFTGAVLMNRFDPRGLVASGLLRTGFGNLTLGWLTLNAGFRDLALPGVVSGLGKRLFFVPRSALAFRNIGSDRQDHASGICGVLRSLGSPVGIAIVGWQVASRSQFHWSVPNEQITPFNPEVTADLRPLDLSAQSPQGAEMMAGLVAAQPGMLAFQDAFWLTGWAAFLMLPVVLVLQRPAKGARPPAGAH